MKERPTAVLLVFCSGLLCLLASPVAGQDADAARGFALELRAGLGPGTSVEPSLDTPDFRLWPEDVGSTARFEAAVLLPAIGDRLRPQARIGLSPNGDVEGLLMNELSRCPTCRDPFTGELDRLDLTVGAEIPMFRGRRRLQPYASLGLGVRRWSFSWDAFTGPGGVALAGRSISETELLGRFGLGAAYGLGPRAVSLEGTLQAGPIGSGTVPVEPGGEFSATEIDHGRELAFDFVLTLGLRQRL